MVLAAQAGSIEPGAEAETVVLVRNTGDEPDVFHVVVQGEASAWALVDPPSVSLAPGQEAPVWVHFRPPRSSDTPPGRIPFAVAVASTRDPSFVSVETGDLDIGTFSSVTASLAGEATVGTWWAELPVSVRNTGNRRVTTSLVVEPADEAVGIEVVPESQVLDPGQPAVLAVRVRAPRRLVPRRREDRRIAISVVSDGGALATIRTEYPADPSLVNELVRSARVLGVLLVLLFAGGIALLRSESTSGTVAVTQGGGTQPADLPTATTTTGPEVATTAAGATEPTPVTVATTLPTAAPAAPPPALPRLVFVRVDGSRSQDVVVREPGARGTELRLRSEGALESRPKLSPDGSHVAFVRSRDGAWRICVLPVGGGEAVCLASETTADAAVAWSPDGTALHFSRGGTLFTVPFDVATSTAGVEVDTGVAVPGGAFALSPDGGRVAVAEGRTIVLRPLDATATTSSIEVPLPATEVTWSPDGTRLAYTANFHVYTVSASGGAVRQLTVPGTVNGEPAWTGAGDWIVFRSNRSGTGDLYAVRATAGAGDEAGLAQITSSPEREVTPSF